MLHMAPGHQQQRNVGPLALVNGHPIAKMCKKFRHYISYSCLSCDKSFVLTVNLPINPPLFWLRTDKKLVKLLSNDLARNREVGLPIK